MYIYVGSIWPGSAAQSQADLQAASSIILHTFLCTVLFTSETVTVLEITAPLLNIVEGPFFHTLFDVSGKGYPFRKYSTSRCVALGHHPIPHGRRSGHRKSKSKSTREQVVCDLSGEAGPCCRAKARGGGRRPGRVARAQGVPCVLWIGSYMRIDCVT